MSDLEICFLAHKVESQALDGHGFAHQLANLSIIFLSHCMPFLNYAFPILKRQ